MDYGDSLIIAIIVIAIYFLPSIVAIARAHHSFAGIGILNVFLGWTLIGWVVALVWSVSDTKSPSANTNTKSDISARKSEPERRPARVLLGKSADERVTRCPHCKHRQPVAFEDAQREKVTCEKCWKTFPIYVP